MNPAAWEGLEGDAWASEIGLPAVRVLSVTDSTNDDARAWAEAGAPAGALVIAESQGAGRGRDGAAWWSPPGASLYASFVLRPIARDTADWQGADGRLDTVGARDTAGSRDSVGPGVLALRVGLALAAALRDAYGFEARLKWPNDILGERGKVAGVLCESVLAGGRPAFVIAGVGVNLARPSGRPPELRDVASSIEEETGSRVDRTKLLRRLGPRMATLATAPLTPLTEEERSTWAASDRLVGCAVRLPDGTAAVARGVTPDGALRLDVPGVGSRTHVGGAVRLATDPRRRATDGRSG